MNDFIMTHEHGKVIANREEAIPVLILPTDEENNTRQSRSHSHPPRPSPPDNHSARDKLRSLHAHASARIRAKGDESPESKNESSGSKSVQDRLMNLLLTQILPPEEKDESGGHDTATSTPKRTAAVTSTRPNFSIPTMSANFRRFNARIGIAFVFQTKVNQLFAWKHPTQTLSFLAIYTFTCLDPSMLAIIPLALLLYFVMFPAFVARHPPPPTTSLMDLYPLTGPPLAPATNIKPAPELSKDFFRNMRDLQNSMEDFSRLHDFVLANVAPLTNFSDETISSALFIALFSLCLLLFLAAHLIPFRLIFLLAGWLLILSSHPSIAALLSSSADHESVQLLNHQETLTRTQLLSFARHDISLSTSPETRQVEIFELQFRPLYYSEADEWTPVHFSPVPYTPLSPARIQGIRPRGARVFEDVVPPEGWDWADKKWSLDLGAREWVEERIITGVEVEVEGGRWVLDVVEKEGGGVRHGEWRRRRWVRVVERVPLSLERDRKEK